MSSSDRLMLVLLVVSFAVLGGSAAVAQTPSSADRVAHGCDLYYSVRFDEAITELEAVLAEGNLTAEARQNARICLARAYVKAGKPDRARTLFRQVLTEDPDWRADPVVFPPDEFSVYEWVLREMGLQQEPAVQPTPPPPSPQARAQTPPPAAPRGRSRHQFGFSGGVNFANLGGDTSEYGQSVADILEAADPGSTWGSASASSRKGAAVGAHYMFQVAPNVGLRLEANYAERGADYSLSGFDSNGLGPIPVDVEYRYSFVELTPIAQVYLTTSSVKPVLLGGLALGFNTKADEEISVAGFSLGPSDVSEFTNGTYVGLVLGAGIEVEASSILDLEIQGRFVRGLTNILSGTLGDVFNVVPNDLEVLVGLGFRPSN